MNMNNTNIASLWKKTIIFCLSVIMVFSASTVAFADSFLDNSNDEYLNEDDSITNENADETKGRWVYKNVKEVSNKSFTLYNKKKTRKVSGVYDKIATYRVYQDGSGKKYHVKDTYHYTWTGYYKDYIDTNHYRWEPASGYINVHETYVDRGPVVELFSYLI